MVEDTEFVEEQIQSNNGEPEPQEAESEDSGIDNNVSEDAEVKDEDNSESEEKESKESENTELSNVPVFEDEQEDSEDSWAGKKAPDWVNKVRKQNRELIKENREIREKINKKEVKAEFSLPNKPRIDDFDTDEEFEESLDNWYKKKIEVDKEKEVENLRAKKLMDRFESRKAEYRVQSESLDMPDFEVSEYAVDKELPSAYKDAIIECSDKPAQLIYALGRSPEKLKSLSSLYESGDHARFVREITLLETKLTTNERKRPSVKPERKLSGGDSPTAMNRDIDSLREKARETGNWDEVAAYRRRMNKAR